MRRAGRISRVHQLGAEICACVHGEWFVQQKTKKIIRDSVYPILYGAKIDIQAGFGERTQVAPDRIETPLRCRDSRD
jgi:hypothetical protein